MNKKTLQVRYADKYAQLYIYMCLSVYMKTATHEKHTEKQAEDLQQKMQTTHAESSGAEEMCTAPH